MLDSVQALRTGMGNLSITRLRPSLPETLKKRSDHNAHNSVRYKADGSQHREEGEINSKWRVEWRTLHQRSNEGDLTVVQWLRLHASSAGVAGSILGRGTKNSHALQPK